MHFFDMKNGGLITAIFHINGMYGNLKERVEKNNRRSLSFRVIVAVSSGCQFLYIFLPLNTVSQKFSNNGFRFWHRIASNPLNTPKRSNLMVVIQRLLEVFDETNK